MSKHQKKSGTKKKRTKNQSRRGAAQDSVQSTGLMAGMVGGFRRAVGVEKSKQSSTGWNVFWTAVVVVLAIVIFLWNLDS